MRLKWVVGVLVALFGMAFGLSGGGAAHATSAAKLSDVVFSSNSYGSSASSQLANLRSGPVAPVSVSCTTEAPLKRVNSAASVSRPTLGSIGAVETSARSAATATTKSTYTTSSTAGVNLLGGLIKSSAVSASSVVRVDSAGRTTASGASTLADLRIGGVAVTAKPAPNTTVALRVGDAVIGKVVLNERFRSTDDWSGSMTTRALSVYITSANSLKLPVGTRIIVGNAKSALKAAPAGKLGGNGFAVRARLADGTVKAGSYGAAAVPCLGGTGRASVASVGLPGLVDAGVATTTTEGEIGTSSRSAATSKVESLKLLGGLVSVDAVTASTSTTRSAAGQPVQVTNASEVANLRVLGAAVINGKVEPNTVVKVPGVATITLNKVKRTSTGITVTMLEIKLEKVLGTLPTGSIIEVGYSRTSVG